MSWQWYGVKTLYRTEAPGRPAFTDANYDANATLIEERIVVFKARSFDEAIRKAEKEAHTYAAGINYENIYGQRVRARYLESCDAHELFDVNVCDSGTEVYSDTETANKSLSDAAIIKRKMTTSITEDERMRRLKFIKGDLARAMMEHFARNTEEEIK